MKNPLLGGVPVGEALPLALGRGGFNLRYTLIDRPWVH